MSEANCCNCGAPAEPVCSYCKTPGIRELVGQYSVNNEAMMVRMDVVYGFTSLHRGPTVRFLPIHG